MSQQDIIRAWKDEKFRHSLSEAQRSQLPANPAGTVELRDIALESIAGGRAPSTRDCTYYPVCPPEF